MIQMSVDDTFNFNWGYVEGCEAGFNILDNEIDNTFGSKSQGRVPTWFDRGFVKGLRDALESNVRACSDAPLRETLAYMEAKHYDGRTPQLYEADGKHKVVKPSKGVLWTYADAARILGCAKVVFTRVRDIVVAGTGEGEPNRHISATAPFVPLGRVILIPADQMK